MTQNQRDKVKAFFNGWSLKDLLTLGGIIWMIFQRWEDVGDLKQSRDAHATTLGQHQDLLGKMVTIDEVQRVEIEELRRRVGNLERVSR